MNKTLVPALAVVAALGAGGWWYTTQTGTSEPIAASAVMEEHQIHPLDMPLGNQEASVVMVEYSSLTCPHCATFNQGPFQQIKENFIDTGEILYLKREVYFDRYGLWAAMVARCGGEERYHGMLDLIYETQSTWAGSNDPVQVANNLRRLGRQAGMDDAQLNACLEDADKALELTEFYQANAETYGIRSTPSFIINGQSYGNMPYAEFERILNEKLGN
ncbi:DsbA family protein [Roseinatronobacter bogoriensis]|uniref:Thiol-disulfide oxidoreductase n=1 Tax=Roseinatronobacter bogoriensis subsp. barguzinensis TaxID=441209 RepID=A0A2K8K8T8_9RHOB|nr:MULTISPECIES: DsbA family protein [Rhodobaca]ATX65867.1 thiol-disulfide oxidoreductase [Rhodobaca barguzinensis]MBB4208165.1 protein-disulfide isomerase [Rhodobaca bogoriensis DSM 18756]TDW38806.1 thioredoxin-like protein [Rhodobaca barguzinensis]TDY69156.1 thioredoxin-like protein [Rhodobaca bogoriensis DSM 18756]